eukprot:SAG11_NODE_5149_length_1646_cov_3.250162_2_plen_167_part_00
MHADDALRREGERDIAAPSQSRKTLRTRQPSASQNRSHKKMRTTALLSLLSLWTEMTAVHAGKTETSCGQLITVAATGSDELISTAHEEKESSARPGDSTVSGDFLAVGGMIFLPDSDSEFYGISGIAASCGAVSHLDESLTLFDERHFICRCVLPVCTSDIESGR